MRTKINCHSILALRCVLTNHVLVFSLHRNTVVREEEERKRIMTSRKMGNRGKERKETVKCWSKNKKNPVGERMEIFTVENWSKLSFRFCLVRDRGLCQKEVYVATGKLLSGYLLVYVSILVNIFFGHGIIVVGLLVLIICSLNVGKVWRGYRFVFLFR